MHDDEGKATGNRSRFNISPTPVILYRVILIPVVFLKIFFAMLSHHMYNYLIPFELIIS